MIFCTPSAYWPSQTKVLNSPRSSSSARPCSPAMRACPWLTSGWLAGSRCRMSLIFIGPPSSLVLRVLRDRHSEIVPAVACIEQPIVVAFELSRKEHDEASPDVPFDELEQL